MDKIWVKSSRKCQNLIINHSIYRISIWLNIVPYTKIRIYTILKLNNSLSINQNIKRIICHRDRLRSTWSSYDLYLTIICIVLNYNQSIPNRNGYRITSTYTKLAQHYNITIHRHSIALWYRTEWHINSNINTCEITILLIITIICNYLLVNIRHSTNT